MIIQVKDLPNLTLPKQANQQDAGYDVVATSDPKIVGERIPLLLDSIGLGPLYKNVLFVEYETNLYISPQSEHEYEQFKETECRIGCDVGDELKEPRILSTQGFHTQLWPRSSISKYNLTLANSIGLIDQGYRGQLLFRFKYHFQPEDLLVVPEAGVNRLYGTIRPEKIYQKGDRIGQVVAIPTTKIEFKVVKDLDASERGEGGLGSTGK